MSRRQRIAKAQLSMNPTSQIGGYCNELHKLAQALHGMLSQSQSLRMPLGEDRAALLALSPQLRQLTMTLEQALATQDPAPPAAAPGSAPAQRTSGARMIAWSKQPETPAATPQSGPARQQPPAPPPEPARPPAKQHGGARLRADHLMLNLSDDAEVQAAADENVTLQGTNETLKVSGVFAFVSRLEKTGTLRIRTNEETLTFQFVSGDIVFSETDNPPPGERLGEIMVSLGIVSAGELDKLLARHDSTKRLGAALEREECIALDGLREALEVQMKRRLDRASEAEQSAFTFSEGGPPTADQRVRLNVTQLLQQTG